MSQPNSSNTSKETPKASVKKTASARNLFIWFLVIVVGVAVSIVALSLSQNDKLSNTCIGGGQSSLRSDGQITTPKGEQISYERRDTPSGRQLGLSGTSCIARSEGMLFVFETSEKHGIWMRDMNYPIDIVWLDESKRVVTIEENISPATYPNIFRPSSNARYILELGAGGVDLFSLGVGTQLYW